MSCGKYYPGLESREYILQRECERTHLRCRGRRQLYDLRHGLMVVIGQAIQLSDDIVESLKGPCSPQTDGKVDNSRPRYRSVHDAV